MWHHCSTGRRKVALECTVKPSNLLYDLVSVNSVIIKKTFQGIWVHLQTLECDSLDVFKCELEVLPCGSSVQTQHSCPTQVLTLKWTGSMDQWMHESGLCCVVSKAVLEYNRMSCMQQQCLWWCAPSCCIKMVKRSFDVILTGRQGGALLTKYIGFNPNIATNSKLNSNCRVANWCSHCLKW